MQEASKDAMTAVVEGGTIREVAEAKEEITLDETECATTTEADRVPDPRETGHPTEETTTVTVKDLTTATARTQTTHATGKLQGTAGKIQTPDTTEIRTTLTGIPSRPVTTATASLPTRAVS